MQEYKEKALKKNTEVCTVFSPKQQLGASPNIVTVSWKSQYRSSLRHHMQVYTTARGKRNREKNSTTTATESNSLAYTSQTDK